MTRPPLIQETDTPGSSQHGDQNCLANISPRGLLGLAIAGALFGGAIAIDLLVIGHSFRAEGNPNFGWPYLAKTFLIGLGALQFVWAIVNLEGKTHLHSDSGTGGFYPAQHRSLPFSFLEYEKQDSLSRTVKKFLIYTVLALDGLFLAFFLYSPELFHELGGEDYPIEWGSAILSFISCGIMGYVAFMFYQSSLRQKTVYVLGTLALAFTFFLIAMEEISWFQRVFSIETPEAFSKNYQGELNFHNFFTNSAEAFYYFGSFGFCIVLPFVKEHTALTRRLPALDFLIPSRFILFVSAIFVAYNYDAWNIIFTQVGFFITCFILTYYSFVVWKTGEPWFIPILLLGMVMITQLIFLFDGQNFIKGWDVTEYKEFFIPLSFLFYSVEILSKSIQLCVAHSK